MKCRRCGKDLSTAAKRCPHCGIRLEGVFQTSTVFISVDGEDSVYRTIEEAPARLRERLVRSIHGSNSATIVIADRRGRRELLRTLRRPSGAPRRRPRRLIPDKRYLIAAIVLLALAIAGMLIRL